MREITRRTGPIIFVCGFSDLYFCPPDYLDEIIGVIRQANSQSIERVYYFQSKSPSCLQPIAEAFPTEDNIRFVTTLESNRDQFQDPTTGQTSSYRNALSEAPPPPVRYRQFLQLAVSPDSQGRSRKIITVEPIVSFDLRDFVECIVNIKPRYIWLGYDSGKGIPNWLKPRAIETMRLLQELEQRGIEVVGKYLRGITRGFLPHPSSA